MGCWSEIQGRRVWIYSVFTAGQLVFIRLLGGNHYVLGLLIPAPIARRW